VVAQGAHVLRDGGDAVLIATGSEVPLALQAAEVLDERGISLRVVSMPCIEAFRSRGDAYRAEILGDLPAASLEAGVSLGWAEFVGPDGLVIGIDHFGASAPWKVIAEQYGFTPEAVADRVQKWLA
jgi:transketolase